MDGIINVLPEHIANKIAAGEVVERPSSIVKELIENSIDAGASDILVEIKAGGKHRIKIIDDGRGMVRSDAVVSLQRHATSKIKDVDDIFSIKTLGFRGEALPSIASVSNMQLLTAQKNDEVGTSIRIEGGKICDIKDCPPIPGTSIDVTDLFYNTPARLKFLKTDSTEISHINSVILHQALSQLNIRFKLVNEKRVTLNLPPTEILIERIALIFGEEFAENMLEVSFSAKGMSLSGFVSSPTYNRGSRDNQYLFINRRFVKNKTIGHAVYQAYKSLLPRDRHPVFFLFLKVDHTIVDINVHPSKMEVRFSGNSGIHNFVLSTIRNTLERSHHNSQISSYPVHNPSYDFDNSTKSQYSAELPQKEGIKEAISKYYKKEKPDNVRTYTPLFQVNDKKGVEKPVENTGQLGLHPETESDINTLVPVGQIFNTFIILQGYDQLLIMDQHTAHERVLYEKVCRNLESSSLQIQDLLFPVQIELSIKEKEQVKTRLEDFKKVGFNLEYFGGNTFVLRSVPAVLSEDNPKKAVMDLIDSTNESSKTDLLEKMILTISCRGAVKAGQKLLIEEMNKLTENLKEVKLPYTCPHGRPILLSIDKEKILKGFLRK